MRAPSISALLCVLCLAACMPADPPPPSAVPSALSSPGDWRNFVKPGDAALRSALTEEQYDVTQHEGTEPPFQNA